MAWNFWSALLASTDYGPFQSELRSAHESGTLTIERVHQALRRHFPRLPGDHMSVLVEHPGRASFLDWLEEQIITQ